MGDWAGLFESASELGVVHVRAGLGLGLSEGALRARGRREAWAAPFPSVFVLPGRDAADPVIRLAAALTSVGSPAYAAAESALWLADVIPATDPPPRPKLLLPHDRRWRPPIGVDVIRSRRVPASHLQRAGGLPATTIARALCDLAAGGASRARVRALALRARRLGARQVVEDLRACQAAFGPGRRGAEVVEGVIRDLATDGADSSAEYRWRQILRGRGIPVWHEPFPFRCDDGVVVHLDVAVPRAWVVLEHDGEGPHSEPGTFRTDRIRWSQITRQWSPVWATAEDLVAPERVIAEVEARIAAADPNRPPATPAR